MGRIMGLTIEPNNQENYLHSLGDSVRVAIGLYESAREKSHAIKKGL